MKILYYDCFAGISGDMNLGAMIDLGVDPDYLKSELKKLNIDEEFELEITRELKMGITGTKLSVLLKHAHHPHDEHKLGNSSTDHGHSHHDAKSTSNKKHIHTHQHHAPHRNVADIEKIIDGSELPENVKITSKKIFMHVALAEAKVHSKPLNEIHFHEVGATDSIVDIVGAAICYHRLGVEHIMSRPIELGGGFVKCAHGVMPVPAPATAEIVQNIPTTLGAVNSEATTPTGAAILKTLVSEFTTSPQLTLLKTAYGIGHRDTEIPNVLRVYLAETNDTRPTQTRAALIECNIDDMNPELYSYLMDQLFENGANDVHYTPITMKKNRPGIQVTVLCDPADEQALVDCLLTESSTIGVKRSIIQKTVLQREALEIETAYGLINVKKVWLPNGSTRLKPEYDDVRRIATSEKESITIIYNNILKDIHHS